MKWFLLGMGVGVGAGLFLAPQDGAKTRSELSDRINDWMSRPRDQGESAGTQRPRAEQTKEAQSDQGQPEPSIRQQLEEEDEAVAEVLNTAKRDELMSVKGIGRATAKRIIKHRPYHNEEEVLEEGVLKEEMLDKVKEELLHKDSGAA